MRERFKLTTDNVEVVRTFMTAAQPDHVTVTMSLRHQKRDAALAGEPASLVHFLLTADQAERLANRLLKAAHDAKGKKSH